MNFKTYCIFALLCVSSLGAKDVSLEIDAGSGYREDTMNMNYIQVSEPPAFEVFNITINKEKSIPIWAFAKVNFNNIILLGEGDYSSIVGGNTDIVFFLPTNQGTTDETIPAFFTAKNRGHIYDVLGSSGYQIFLYINQNTAFSITPRGGYGTHQYRLKFKNVKPDIFDMDTSGTAVAGLIVTIQMEDFAKIKTSWKGPFIAADATLKFLKNYRLSATYAYHWLDMKNEHDPTFLLRFVNLGFFARVTKILHSKLSKAWSHRVQGNLSYLINKDWTISLFGQYQIFKTKAGLMPVGDRGESTAGPIYEDTEVDLFKISSRMYSVALRASYKF